MSGRIPLNADLTSVWATTAEVINLNYHAVRVNLESGQRTVLPNPAPDWRPGKTWQSDSFDLRESWHSPDWLDGSVPNCWSTPVSWQIRQVSSNGASVVARGSSRRIRPVAYLNEICGGPYGGDFAVDPDGTQIAYSSEAPVAPGLANPYPITVQSLVTGAVERRIAAGPMWGLAISGSRVAWSEAAPKKPQDPLRLMLSETGRAPVKIASYVGDVYLTASRLVWQQDSQTEPGPCYLGLLRVLELGSGSPSGRDAADLSSKGWCAVYVASGDGYVAWTEEQAGVTRIMVLAPSATRPVEVRLPDGFVSGDRGGVEQIAIGGGWFATEVDESRIAAFPLSLVDAAAP